MTEMPTREAIVARFVAKMALETVASHDYATRFCNDLATAISAYCKVEAERVAVAAEVARVSTMSREEVIAASNENRAARRRAAKLQGRRV